MSNQEEKKKKKKSSKTGFLSIRLHKWDEIMMSKLLSLQFINPVFWSIDPSELMTHDS